MGMFFVSWYAVIHKSMEMAKHLFVTRIPFAKMKLIGNNFINQQERMIFDFSNRQSMTFSFVALLKSLFRKKVR